MIAYKEFIQFLKEQRFLPLFRGIAFDSIHTEFTNGG